MTFVVTDLTGQPTTLCYRRIVRNIKVSYNNEAVHNECIQRIRCTRQRERLFTTDIKQLKQDILIVPGSRWVRTSLMCWMLHDTNHQQVSSAWRASLAILSTTLAWAPFWKRNRTTPAIFNLLITLARIDILSRTVTPATDENADPGLTTNEQGEKPK